MTLLVAGTAHPTTAFRSPSAAPDRSRQTAETLPPAAYHAEVFYDAEVEAIFRSDWVCVGHVSAVPQVGDYLCVDVVGEPLVIVRGEDRLRVLSRACRHRWVPVASGAGRAKLFSCPFHKWTYALDGRLLAAPFMQGSEGFDLGECSLPEIRTEVIDDLGLIFINFSDAEGSIGERLLDLRQRFARWTVGELATVSVVEMDSAFNWKIQSETFMECYHHIGAHAETFEYDQPARLSFCEDGNLGWSLCVSPFRQDAPAESRSFGLPTFADLTEAELGSVFYVNVFPNVLLAFRPDNVSLMTVFPEGPQRTTARRITLARAEATTDPQALDRAISARAEFAERVALEDNAVNELQQVGVRSRLARPGRLSQLETTVWDLANYVRRRVADVGRIDARQAPPSHPDPTP